VGDYDSVGGKTHDAALRRIRALEAALRKYGIHTLACASLRNERCDCDCGWTEMLTSNFTQETSVREVHSKSEQKRLTALGVECAVKSSKETNADPIDTSGKHVDKSAFPGSGSGDA